MSKSHQAFPNSSAVEDRQQDADEFEAEFLADLEHDSDQVDGLQA